MANEFKVKNGLIVDQGGANITGSVSISENVTAVSFTGSLFGTASWAENAISASYALTASYLNTLNQDLTFNGNLTLNGTASIAYLNVTYESASVIYSSGSNQFGDDTNDIQTLIGTVIVSGSQQITGSLLLTSSFISTVDYIDFNNTGIAPPTDIEGRIYWDEDNGTLSLGMHGGQVVQQVGLESYFYIKNQSGVTIPNGSVVRAAGTLGASGRILGDLMIADNSITYYFTLGIATEDIINGEDGYVTNFGAVRGINTTGAGVGETWVDGDVLWVSPTVSGGLTKFEPDSPNLKIQMAIVIKSAVNGTLFVRPDLSGFLTDLHNVNDFTTTGSFGDLLVKSGSTWIDSKQLTGSYGLTGSLSATSFTGSLQGTSSWSENALTASYVNPLNQHVIITGSLTVSGSSTLRNIGPAEFTGSLNVTGSTTLNGTLNVDNKYYFINTLSDLPTPAGNIITLVDNGTYVFTTTVDLLGNRLVCGQNTTLLGGSSENSRIKSTGLTTEPLISSSYSIPMRGLTIEADIALSLIASGSTQAIDWFGVNFTNCPTVGVIKDYSNVIMTDCAFLEAANCVFDGTIGTVGFITCLFNGRSGQTTMTLSTTGSITRRFRPIYTSFIALAGETALNIPAASIVNAEGYILDTCNFSGGGTYLTGANTGSLKSLFVNNVGINNTTNVGHYYMINNTTATTIGVANTNVFVKAAGTTTIGIGNSPKWVGNGNNRIDYSGSIAQDFKFTAVGTVQTATTNQVISVAVAKNGTFQAESEITVRTAVANQPYPFAVQDLVAVAAGDFVEVFVRNTSSTNVVVGDLNVIIDKIGS